MRILGFGLLMVGWLPGCAMVSTGGGTAAGEGDVPDVAALTARLIEGEDLLVAGQAVDAIEVFFGLPDNAPTELRARALTSVRKASALLSDDELAAAVAAAPPGLRLQTPLLARYASVRTGAEARALAERILALGAEDPEATVARDILSNSGPGFVSTFGAILPEGATVGLQEFGAEIRDGIQLALAFSESVEFDLEVFDDRADPEEAVNGIIALTESGAFGIIGPLFEEALAEAAEARTSAIPLVSPTASRVPEGARGVYTLAGVDVGDAVLLGEFAAEQRFSRIVVVYPSDPDGIAEANAFRDAVIASGGIAPIEIALDPDTADFRGPIQRLRQLDPDAIALLLTEEQVQGFAPQYTFYGLDAIDAQRLGSASWGSESVVSGVQQRHTEGVIAAVPVSPLGQGSAYLEFVRRYEETFQRGLTSDAPTLGYDSALLLLAAAERSRMLSLDPISAFEGISGVEGATGILSVQGGKIVRLHHLVRIENRVLVPFGG